MKTRIDITITVELDNGQDRPVSGDEVQDFICSTQVSVTEPHGIRVGEVAIDHYRRRQP